MICSSLENHKSCPTAVYLLEALDLLPLTANRHVEARLLDALGYNHSLLGDYRAALEYHAASGRIAQEIHQPGHLCHTLRNRSTAQHKLGNLTLAEQYALEALRLALVHKLPNEIAQARLVLGYVWLAADNLPEAKMAFQLAYDSWHAQQLINLSQEALVGLATVELRDGKLTQAAARIAALVPALLQHVPVGMRHPYEIQLACYEILTAVGDARAQALLATTYAQLQYNAAQLSDKQLRHSFWQAPEQGRVRALWQQMDSDPCPQTSRTPVPMLT